MTKDDLKVIKQRCEAASKGPWEWEEPRYLRDRWYQFSLKSSDRLELYPGVRKSIFFYDGSYHPDEKPSCPCTEDIEFITHAREDIPKLIAEIELLQRT